MKQLLSFVVGISAGALVGYELGGRSGERHGRNAAIDELGAAARAARTMREHDVEEPIGDVKPGSLVTATSRPVHPVLDEPGTWPIGFGTLPTARERDWPENYVEG